MINKVTKNNILRKALNNQKTNSNNKGTCHKQQMEEAGWC